MCKTLLRAGLCVMEVTSDQPEGKWRLVAEGFDARQLQRLTQALQTGPAPAHPRPQNEGRSVFEFTTPQDEEAIVLHALSVARQLKARVCLRGVTALA